MTKTAILVDGGWMALELAKLLGVKYASADQIYTYAKSVLHADEELYRFFYYDAEPYNGKAKNPISKQEKDFSSTKSANARRRFFEELVAKPQVALRLGTVSYHDWKLTDTFYNGLINGTLPTTAIRAEDIMPNFSQKGVDMRIGIDIASLVFKKIVSRIILFSGDTDMIPAMKLARVEGVQIVVVQIGASKLVPKLIEDSDFVRELQLLKSSAMQKQVGCFVV